MLPLGRKNARRCTECDITCHANCAHLVPDFCGMSMETANMLLKEAREVSRRKEEQKRRQTAQPAPRTSPQQQYLPPPPEVLPPTDQMANMTMAEIPQQQSMGDYGYMRQSPAVEQPPIDPRMQGMPPGQYPQQPAAGRPGRPPMAPPFPTEPHQPYPGRPGAPPAYDMPPQGLDGYQVCTCAHAHA